MIEKFLEELPEKVFRLGIRIVLAFLVLLVGVQLIKLARSILKKGLKRSRVDESAVRFIDSFVKYSLYFLLVILIASWMGVDAASIIALLGSASVAVGLALQGSLSNLAGGVLILILKPFSIGDYIRDGLGNEGTVDTIDVFYTHLITPDNKSIVLPNGTLSGGCITNYTKCDRRRIDISVGIAYEEDIRKAREVLLQVLMEEPGILKDEDMRVFVDSLADSAVLLNVRGWAEKDAFWETKWRLAENVKYALDDAGIRIPFPQMDVHLDRK
ncbi:MAG: mechanosensitive ion channel [Lachnospiraceae bacterium]|nr:mechanosensitive ion channel [Lachnospiraceae bacterium]MDE6815464.1 mechanosensitive ion channel [Lachnospiraceae bacterium]